MEGDIYENKSNAKQSESSSSESVVSDDSDSDSEDSEAGFDELCVPDQEEIEDNSSCMPAVCLFCDYEDSSAQKLVLVHFQEAHQLNLIEWIQKFRLGQLQYIKMVNYFRKVKGTLAIGDVIKSISEGTQFPPWRSDEYFSVANGEDPLLFVSLEEFVESDDEEYLIEVNKGEFGDHSECNRLISLIKNAMHRVMDDNVDELARGPSTSTPKSLLDDLNEDNVGYFESYDDVEIHASMLNDFPRTDGYRRALEEGDLCKNISVLDVGCGTGILSLFAAQAGASYVCAIDQSDIIVDTIDIVHENKLQDIIKCVKGVVENFSHDKVDLIVSEWMGYFLLFEGMLNSFLYARDTFLKENGVLIPSQASMFIAGVSDKNCCNIQLNMWDNVYGFKMSAMRRKHIKQPQIVLVDPSHVVTDSFEILTLNLYRCKMEDALIDQDFELKSNSLCIMTAIVGFFDTVLNNPSRCPKIILGTGPFDPPTHWKQCVFLLPQGIPLKSGQIIKGNIKCDPNGVNRRWLDVTIKISEPKLRFTYTLN